LLKQTQSATIAAAIGKHAYDQPGITSVLDQLVSQYAAQLKPGEVVVGFAYWENQVYPKAGAAYAETPRTPLTSTARFN